jgi:D-amino peptidase
MTEEASAAVRGAFNAGAESVVVADSHAWMRNIVPDLLDPRARLVAGSPRQFSMVQGLDSTFDALVLIGFHAAAGTVGVMAHTYSGQSFSAIEIDGRTVGEVELFAGHAAELGVPLALVSGDDALARETREVFPDTRTVLVKECLSGWAANSLSPVEARTRIESAVAEALQTGTFGAPRPPETGPFTVSVDMSKQVYADACALLPNITRSSATGISFDSPDYGTAIRIVQALALIAMGVQQ